VGGVEGVYLVLDDVTPGLFLDPAQFCLQFPDPLLRSRGAFPPLLVESAGDALDLGPERSLRLIIPGPQGPGTLEEHVLQEVGDPRLAVLLLGGAYEKAHGKGHGG
jgi:hypothetical protein